MSQSSSDSTKTTKAPKTPPKPTSTRETIIRTMSKVEWRELNPFFGAACLLAAVGAFLTTAYFAAAALALIGVAFLLFWRDLRPWEEVPRWKRVTITTLIWLGGGCLVIYLIIQLGPGYY